MDINSLKSALLTPGLLKYINYFDKLSSTNKHAKSIDVGDDILVLAGCQEQGIGRFGREWRSSQSDDITFSLIKNLRIDIDSVQLISFYISYILLISFRSYCTNVNFKLKWPNDILANNKKVSGILIEVQNLKSPEKRFIIGAGINVNGGSLPDNIKHKATSLYMECGEIIDRTELLIIVIENFYENLVLLYEKNLLLQKWKQNCDLIGKQVSFKEHDDSSPKTGVFSDVSNDGAIVIVNEKGEGKEYYSGEISLSSNY